MTRPATTPNSNPGPSDARVEALLRAGAAARTFEGSGRMRADVTRAIRAGARSEESHAGVFHNARHWWGMGGALAAALVSLVILVGGPSTPMSPLAPTGETLAQSRPAIRLIDIAGRPAPRIVAASAQLAERPLEDEARRLKADVTRGINYLRSTMTLARAK